MLYETSENLGFAKPRFSEESPFPPRSGMALLKNVRRTFSETL
jgi:hypothetical protein